MEAATAVIVVLLAKMWKKLMNDEEVVERLPTFDTPSNMELDHLC